MLNFADISSVQGTNLSGILSANDGVIVKATEGNYYVNPQFSNQAGQVTSAGKLLGIYHFINGGVPAETQAQYLLDNIGDYANRSDVPLILDFENNGATNADGSPQYPHLTGTEIKPFADYIKAKTGKTIMLYVGQSDVKGYNLQNIGLPMWVAGYPLNDGSGYTQELQEWADSHYFNGFKDKMTMWQYTSTPYDKSVFYADESAWKGLSQGGQVATTQPAVQKSAIQKFKDGGDRFALRGPFTCNTCQRVNGIYQVMDDDLCADPFSWTDNGIPTGLLNDLSDPSGRTFEDGVQVQFKPQYQTGTIDRYSENANAVGIDFLDGNGIIWFDADKFWNHA